MKITGLSFFGGIVFTVLIFAFMCCAIGEDFIRHKDRRHPSLYKYVIFIFMGILLTVQFDRDALYGSGDFHSGSVFCLHISA